MFCSMFTVSVLRTPISGQGGAVFDVRALLTGRKGTIADLWSPVSGRRTTIFRLKYPAIGLREHCFWPEKLSSDRSSAIFGARSTLTDQQKTASDRGSTVSEMKARCFWSEMPRH